MFEIADAQIDDGQPLRAAPGLATAIKLGQQIYAFAARPAFRRQRSLRDQIERAAVSISNNIAEGFERGGGSRECRVTNAARVSTRSRKCN
ncbi:MAG TPA: four helix bundle protein [Terriglobia bacterium]|nr:four helix bundle protein [Terriglobia bacterium]